VYACLDIGSNSFHMLVAEIEGSEIRIKERYSARVQLGEGIAGQGIITTDAMARGEQCLRWFARHMRRFPVSRLWAVGTNALRQAENAGDFLAMAKSLGFTIDVISGEEEAALVFAGVAGQQTDPAQKSLVIDIGGGSTELIIADSHQLYCCDSLAVGCVSWRERFFSQRVDRKGLAASVSRAEAAAGKLVRSVAATYREQGWDAVYASSGTAKMLSALCAAQGLGRNSISRTCMEALLPRLMNVVLDGQTSLRGLKPARRDVCLPGWSILSALMESLPLEDVVFSPAALREGMLFCMSDQAPAFSRPAAARIIDVAR